MSRHFYIAIQQYVSICFFHWDCSIGKLVIFLLDLKNTKRSRLNWWLKIKFFRNISRCRWGRNHFLRRWSSTGNCWGNDFHQSSIKSHKKNKQKGQQPFQPFLSVNFFCLPLTMFSVLERLFCQPVFHLDFFLLVL